MPFYKKSEKSCNKSFMQSVSAALEGVVHTLKCERNMRLHFVIGSLVVLAGLYFDLNITEFMLLCFAVSFVLVAELFNTAIEHFVDYVEDEYHPMVKTVKDISAGAVFVSAINACVVGYFLLVKRMVWATSRSFAMVKQSPWHITLISLILVVGLVILIKVIRNEKTLLRGGMPSGHSAVAFAVWVIVSLMTENMLVSLLVLFLAVLIAKSRAREGVHTPVQVVAGSIIGALIALLIFQILSGKTN